VCGTRRLWELGDLGKCLNIIILLEPSSNVLKFIVGFNTCFLKKGHTYVLIFLGAYLLNHILNVVGFNFECL